MVVSPLPLGEVWENFAARLDPALAAVGNA